MKNQDLTNSLFLNTVTGEYLKMIRFRENGLNTYIEVDYLGKPIVRKRSWSAKACTQERLVNGFSKLQLTERG